MVGTVEKQTPKLNVSGDISPVLSSSQLATELLAYLRTNLRSENISYATTPAIVSDGWETYVCRFQLRDEGLPQKWQRPLILRIHIGPHGVPRVHHEAVVHAKLSELHFPVPRVLLHESDHEILGGPFLIMEEVQGIMMLQAMLRAPWRIFTSPTQMAETHVRLHELSTEGFPAPAEPTLDPHFQTLTSFISDFDLPGLRPGLDWLKANRPPAPAVPSILHLDYHPMNLLFQGSGMRGQGSVSKFEIRNSKFEQQSAHPSPRTPGPSLAVLDWTYAEVADSHADVATTMMLMECVPVHGQSLRKRITTAIGRPFLRNAYLREYTRRRKIDQDRLAYYRAWASLRRLAVYGRWLRIGPAQTGCRPDVLRRLDHIPVLERYFQKWSGVPVHLEVN